MQTSLSSCPWLLSDQDRRVVFTSTAENFDGLLLSARNRAIIEEGLVESISVYGRPDSVPDPADNGVFSVILTDGDGNAKEVPVAWQITQIEAHSLAA